MAQEVHMYALIWVGDFGVGDMACFMVWHKPKNLGPNLIYLC
jgi:hypothetical protein